MLKTYASSKGGGGTVTSVTGTANRVTVSTGTTTPVIDISATFEALLGKVANPLSQFAATTSAQLRGVLSDENGSGVALFDSSTSATFITPILGTPTSVTLTNATGLPLTTGITGVLPIANGGTAAATTSQNFAFIGPTSGAGAPSFRALVAGDIPSLSYRSTTGTTGDIDSYSATNIPSNISAVATGSLFASAGIGTLPAWSASPTLTTSLTVPLINGGTSSGGLLTLSSTTNATKGRIVFGSSVYDEVNNRLGIGIGAPGFPLDVQRAQNSGTIVNIYNSTSGTAAYSGFQFGTNTSTNAAGMIVSSSAYTSAFVLRAAQAYFYANSAMTGGIGISSEGNNPIYLSTNVTERVIITGAGNVGIGVTSPTAVLHLKAGTATVSTAPYKETAGTLLGTIEPLVHESNASSGYSSTVALNRLAEGGIIADFTADVNNSGTSETDLFTYTTKANTLVATGEKIILEATGTFNDLTATSQLQFYFAGTSIGNTGALTVSAIGAWTVRVTVIRTGASTARATVNLSTPGASTAVYTTETDLTGLTFSGTNIIKITGTAAGASGGSNDITAKMGTIFWWGSANN